MNNNCRREFEPRPDRRSTRLRSYDYSRAGSYFVTICAQNRECLFGNVMDDEMRLNAAGAIVQTVWDELPNHYPNVELDRFVVMPNHLHGIIVIVGAGLKPTPTKHGLPEIVRALKTFSARRINEMRNTPGVPIWQRNYYEHIIRNDESLHRIREYIVNNPAQWALDRENPLRAGFKPTPTAARNHNVSTDKDEPWQT